MDHEKRAHLLSIGEMAEANRVSIATLRLYDRMGLLQPSYRDEETNYRYYDIRQTSRLDIIRYMRNLNMSLTDIQTLLEKEDIMLIEQKLIEKNNQIHQQMRDLKAVSYGDSIEVIESGMFACAYLDDFDEEAEGAERLLAYCRANHYILNGDYICEEMTELNLFDNKKRNMFLSLIHI